MVIVHGGPGSSRFGGAGDAGVAEANLRPVDLREVVHVVVEGDTEKRRDIEHAVSVVAALARPTLGIQRVEVGDGRGPRRGERRKGTFKGVVTRTRPEARLDPWPVRECLYGERVQASVPHVALDRGQVEDVLPGGPLAWRERRVPRARRGSRRRGGGSPRRGRQGVTQFALFRSHVPDPPDAPSTPRYSRRHASVDSTWLNV